MWHKKQAELLRDEMEALLAPLSNVAGLYNLVKEPLTQARRGLGAEGSHDKPWPLLPLIVCGAISGHYECALSATAALQFLMAAGDVFDDIEDADSSESLLARYGSAVATNVATTLLIMAQKSITQLKARGVEDSIVVHVMDSVTTYYTAACAGQHLDLRLGSETSVSEDVYTEVIAMKSASQIECACHIGALLATTNQELVNTFSMFGHNLGMAAQITNDIHGVKCGSDIMERRITLPVIYALTQTAGEVRGELERAFSRQSKFVFDAVHIRNLLFRSGAVHYATIKMELYKQRAIDILSQAERAGVSTKHLKLFLE